MSLKVIVSVMLACAAPAVLVAAEDPANSTLLKQCESAKGEVKRECEQVATEMMKPDANKQPRTDKTSQDVTHSSPAMEADPQAAKPAKPAAAKPTPPKQADKKDVKPE